MYMYISVFDKSFLFGTAQFSLWASGAVDYIVINTLLIGSRCIPNAHINHCWVNLAHASKLIKNFDLASFSNCIVIDNVFFCFGWPTKNAN